ncbi:MAG: GAF domain-containing protein [Steroidobacteraceae bacterium]
MFATMLDNAVRICDATFGGVYRFDGDIVRLVATHNLPPAFAEVARVAPFRPSPKSFIGRIAASKTLVHLEDAAASQPYVERDPATVAAVERGGTRAFLAVPMLKENALIGLLYLCRQQVRPYTDKQIELVQGFANQAVIAIENTRLLNELRESLEQQKASADILSVISNSVTDTQPVFDKILESCKHLFGGDELDVLLVDEQGQLNIAAYIGEAHDVVAATFPAPLERTPAGRAIRERRVMHWPDLVDGEDVPGVLRKMAKLIGYRSMVFAPMLWEGRGIGAIGVARSTGPFKPKELAMLQTFADQAVIAIQNASMFEQVQERTRELSASLDDLRTAQDRLVQTEKLASLGQLTAGIAHEIKNPLNFVNNFSSVSVELIDELREALGGVPLDDKRRTEINEIANMLQGNLDKVVQHGKRADAIVKNMLLHSRQGSGEHRPVDINALVDEALNLAYHGARAEKQGFTITMERSFDPAAGEVDLFPQEITRVLLNLMSNGFYAATKRKAEANGGNYEPTLAAATKNLGDRVEIRIRDNGTGMPPEVKEKMFNPFFTTKPAGEGTGLGLSISHDIIVKQHGGSIEVDTQPGEFTEFRIVLPRTGASLIKSGERA